MTPALRQKLGRLAAQCHPVTMAALVLFALTAAFHFGAVRPLQVWLAQLDTRLAYQGRGNGPDPRLVRTSAAPSRGLEDFYKFFEREQALTDWLASLHSIGKHIGLDMPSADYKLEPAVAGHLNRYQITFPLKANSALVRAFADNALNAIPVLSLDRIVFRKQRTSDSVAEAEVTFSIYVPAPR